MPDNKIDFGEWIASGYDSKTISDYSKNTGGEVILNSPDFYQKEGFTPEQIGALTNAYDAYKRDEYVSITEKPKALYGTPSIVEMILSPETAQFRRGALLSNKGIEAIQAGYDIYGEQIKSPGEVADERGRYVTKDGQWEDLGGEFWNTVGNNLIGLADFVTTLTGVGDVASTIAYNSGVNGLHDLASTKVLQYDPYGVPYWQSFNPYENPKELTPYEFPYKGLFPEDNIDKLNRNLMMNPKGFQRSFYGPQDIESKTVGGGILRGLGDFATTIVPTFTAGIAGMKDVINSISGVQDENKWTYLKSVERGNTLIKDNTKHLRSIESQGESWYQGESLGYSLGDLFGITLSTLATAGVGTAIGLGSRAAGIGATGLMSIYGANTMKETMVDMNMSAKEQAILYPIFAATEFATERLIGGNILENGLMRVTTKESARKWGKEALTESIEESTTKFGGKRFKDLTRIQQIKSIEYGSRNLLNKMLSTEHIPGRMFNTGWEEAREEFWAQLANDVTMTLHDYYVAIEDNTYNVGYVGYNKGDVTFNNYDTNKSLIGNFATNMDGDQYLQSFVLGFFGGLSGGVLRGRNKSKAGEDWLINQVLEGNEKQIKKTISNTDLLLDYSHHDGKRVLNEKDKIEGVPSLNDFAKKKMVEDIDYMVKLRDDLGLRSAEQIKKFSGDKSLLKEAFQLGLVANRLNQEANNILSKEGVTEKEVLQAQEYQRQAAEMNKKLNEEYLTGENGNNTPNKAYNNKLKKALTLYYIAGEQVDTIFKKSNIDINNMTKEQRLKYNNMIKATTILLRDAEIQNNKTIYDRYKEYPQKLEEYKKARQEEINKNISDRTSKLNSYFAEADEKIGRLQEDVNTFIESIVNDTEYKNKDEFKNKKNKFDFDIPDLLATLQRGIEENSAFTYEQKSKLRGYRDIVNNIYNTLENNGLDVEILKEADEYDISDIYNYDDFDEIIINSQRESDNLDPHKNLTTIINEKIDLLSTLINNKSPYSMVKEVYDDIQNELSEAKDFYIIGNKAIKYISDQYLSEDDIQIETELYESMMEELLKSSDRLESLESVVNEYAGNKDVLTRNYKVEEMRLRFQQWNNHITTYDGYGKAFGSDAAEINALIKYLTDKFTRDKKWLTAKDITDEQLEEINKGLTRLADLFYAHAEDIFADENYLKYLLSDIYFGNNGLGSMNGKNDIAANIFDEPINLFNAVDDDNINDFTIPRKSTIIGMYYYKFMSMYLFNNLLAMSGAKMSGLLDQYNEMQKAYNPEDTSTPSSLEQYTMEMQAIGVALSLKKGYADKLINTYIAKVREKVAGADALEHSIDTFPRIQNYFNFTGFGGSGKTKNSVAKIVTLYSRMTGNPEMKVQVVSFNSATTNQLFEEVVKTGHKTKKTQFNKMEEVDVDSDMIIIDESTLVSGEEMEVLRKKIEASKNKPIIIAFGDNTQMTANMGGYNDATFYSGPTLNPLMNVYRTNVAPLIMLQEYFRKMIFVTTFDSSIVDIPKMSVTIDSEDNLIGGEWMPNAQAVIKAANERRDKDIALIVLNKAEKDKVLADPNNKLSSNQIYIATDFFNSREESIQGLQKDEVYIAFNPAILELEAGKVGYTTVGRARNYVAIVGAVNDVNGNPMNVGVSGFIGTKAKPMTVEEKKKQSNDLIKHISNSYDKDNASFDYYKETKKEEPNKNPSSNKKTSAPDEEKQQKSTKDKNGEDIFAGDMVVVNGNITTVNKILGDTIETNSGNSKGTEIVKYNQEVEEDNQPNSYIVDDSAINGDVVGNAVIDKTNPDDIQQRIDRTQYSYFSVNHIAVPIDRTYKNINNIKEHARKIKIRSYSEAFKYAKDNGIFEFEERLTTEWDGQDMVEVRKKVLVLKINDTLTKRFVESYNNSLPESEKIADEDYDAIYDAVTNFFVIPEDSDSSRELYKRLNEDNTLVTRLQIDGEFIHKAPVIGHDKSTPKKDKLPNSQQFKEEATKLGYKTEYIWKVSGRESGKGKGIAYIRIQSPNGKIRDVKLTAFTVAEYNQRKPNGQVRYESMLASEVQNIISQLNTKSISEINKMFHNSATYNFLAKNNLRQYISSELKDSDVKSRLQNIQTLLKTTGLSDMFIAYTNENLGVISRPATLTPFVIGNPQQFAIIKENTFQGNTGNTTNSSINDIINSNDNDLVFERPSQSKGEIKYEEANAIISKILGDTIAEMAVKNIPKDSEFYNDLRNLVGSFTGFFNGNIIGLRTEDGYTKVTTPRHEATHFVMKYLLNPKIKAQLYDEAKQKIFIETGKPINGITDIEAEEFIATTYGNSEGNLKSHWYSKYPIINRFMQKMKMFFAEIGLYSYKINDLLNGMEDGFFANGEVELEESNYMLESEANDIDNDTEKDISEQLIPAEDVGISEPQGITLRGLKDNIGETLYVVYKNWFATGIYEHNIISQTNSTVIDFNESIKQTQKEWIELYPTVTFNTLLEKTDGTTIPISEVVYGNNVNIGLQLNNENKKILAAALFKNNDTSTLFAKANIPEYTADYGIAVSNIGKDGNKKTPQQLAKGLLSLGVNNIRPDGFGTPRVNFSNLLSDFYNSCIAGKNVRPTNIGDVVALMRDVVDKSNKAQETIKNIDRFVRYYDIMQNKYQTLPISKKVILDEYFNSIASILISQNIAPMATAHAIIKDNKVNKVKLISKHFNTVNGLKVEIKNKWNDAIISNGEVTLAASKRVRSSSESKERDTMFVVSDGLIRFTDGQIDSSNYLDIIKVGNNGVFTFTDNYISKLKENDPTAIRSILKIYEFMGIGSIFNTDLLLNLIRDNSDKGFGELYPHLHLQNTNVSDTLGSYIAGMFNSTIVYRDVLDIYSTVINADNAKEYKSETEEEETVNRFKDVLTLYSRGEATIDEVKNTPYVSNKVNSAEELFRDKNIPQGILNNVKYFDTFRNIKKVASGIEDMGTAEDIISSDDEHLRIFKPTDNFPFAELLANIGWEYRINNVDNRIVMPGGGTMSAIGIVSSLNMAKEKALKNNTSVTAKDNMLVAQYEDGDRLNSVFLDENNESEIIEINGYQNKDFGTNEISAADLYKIHLFSYVDGKKNGNIIIPLSTFADSGRNFMVRLSNVSGNKISNIAITAYENQINKAIKNYEKNVTTWISLINKFKENSGSIGIIIPDVKVEDFIGNNMTEANIQKFNDVVNNIEASLYQKINTPDGKANYYKWAKLVAASDLENISGKITNGIAFYNTDMGFFDEMDRTNDKIEYIPIRRYTVGQAGQFGMNRQGLLSMKNMFEYMNKYGKPELISSIKVSSDGLSNYNYIFNKIYPVAKRAWNNIVAEYGGDIPESMNAETVEDKVTLAQDFQEFILMTQLLGEEFMSTYVTGVEAVDTPENMSKYIKTILTPGVRMVENKLLQNNLKVMYVSDTLGVSERGELVNLTDGGDYVSSLAQRIINHSLGGRFAANTAYSNKSLGFTMNNAEGNHKINKSSSFTATDAMIENSPTLRKMEMTMLSHTVINGINFGIRYSELWNEGKKHNEIIDELETIYINNVYNSRRLNDSHTLVWKMIPETNIKRGLSRVNVNTISELFIKSMNISDYNIEPNILSNVTAEDIAFIYNPETKIDETTRTKKTIQKTSVCSWLDYNEDGSIRKTNTLNEILSRQNEISLEKLENSVGIKFDTFLYGTEEQKAKDAKQLEKYMKNVARSGLEGQGTVEVLSEMINNFSLNTPNVYESVMQVFVNQLANKYGHRRGVSGDRMIQQYGHQFLIFVDQKTGRKYNLAELNKIKMMEDIRKGNTPKREDVEYFMNKGYEVRPMGYMKYDDNGIHLGETALTFKYFDFFGLKSGEQPADLCTIWKIDGTFIDIRYWDTLPEFSIIRGELETKYYVKDGEYFNETKDGGIENITEQEYLRNLAFEIANHPEIYDFQNTVLLRNTQASFQDKLMMAKDSLKVQMDRIPYTTPGFTVVSEIVSFINEKIIDSLGNERERLPNTVFINMRESLRDGSDNDGDTKSVFYKSIVTKKGSDGHVFYSFASAKDIKDDNYDKLSNLYFDRIESLLLDKKNIPSVFGVTTTSYMEKTINEKLKQELREGKKEYRQMSDWEAIIDIYQSNLNDSSSIGNFANSSNVFGELITMSMQGYNVYKGPIVKTIEEKRQATNVFSQVLNASVDGVKKSILGPMNIISEFSNLFSYFAMAGKIPAFLIDPNNLTNDKVDFVSNGTDWNNVYDFFNSPLMKKIAKKVVSGRSLMESSFENSIYFTIHTMIKNIEVNSLNYAEFNKELGVIDFSNFDMETYKKAKALLDKIPDTADNIKTRGRLKNIIINLENLRALKELESILPYSESIFMLSQINSQRQKVLSKTFERDAFIEQLNLIFGKDIKHTELGNGIYDIFYDDGKLRDKESFEKKYKEVFGNNYSDIALEYYINHSMDYARQDDDTRVLKKDSISVYTYDYNEYIKKRYESADTIRYAYGLRYGAEYMRNILFEDAIGKELSFIEGNLIPDAQEVYFDDNRDNTYSDKKKRQEIRDGYVRGSINAAFEYVDSLKEITFSYRFKPEGITTANNGIDWTSKENVMRMESQRDRNRFLLSFPSLIRNLKEVINMGKLANAQDAIQYLLNIPSTEEGIEESKRIAKLLQNNKFFNKISMGAGATPVLQYSTKANTEENSAYVLEEKMDFMKLPAELRNMFVAYNLLHYGYRQSKSFLEIVGTSNNYYEEVDKFRDKVLKDWKENNPDMYESFIRQTQDQIYASKKLISSGKMLTERNVHKRAYLHKIHLGVGNKKVINGIKIETALFKDDESNNYIAHFPSMPSIGAEYSYNGKENLSQSELFSITLKVSMRELDTLLKTGELVIPNRISTYQSVDNEGLGIVYLVHGYTCVSDPNYRVTGSMRLKLSDNKYYQNKNAIVIEENIEGTMLQKDRYQNYLKTAKTAADVKIISYRGQLNDYPETLVNSVVVHNATVNGNKGNMNGFQFDNKNYEDKGLTIPVRLCSTARGYGFPLKPENENVITTANSNKEYNKKTLETLKNNIKAVEDRLRKAKEEGKTIIFPKEGIAESLLRGGEEQIKLYNEFSKILLDEYGYLNSKYKEDKTESGGLKMVIFEKISSGRSYMTAFKKYVDSKGEVVPESIESIISEVIDSFPSDRYLIDSNESRISDAVDYIKDILYDYKKDPVSLKERIENEEKKCNQ